MKTKPVQNVSGHQVHNYIQTFFFPKHTQKSTVGYKIIMVYDGEKFLSTAIFFFLLISTEAHNSQL